MNYVPTLIFSDPSLGYDKSYVEVPADINKTYPKNGTGLCNQLFRVINSLNFLSPTTNNLYFDFFSKDMNSGKMMKLSDILSFREMSEKFKYNIFDVTDLTSGEYQVYNDGYFFRTYHKSLENFEKIIKTLIWNERFENLSKSIIKEKNLEEKEVNLVHLRIDKDCKDHIIGVQEKIDYHSDFWPSMEELRHKKNRELTYVGIVKAYEDAIYKYCDKSLPLVILMDEVTHPLVKKLQNDYDVIFFDKQLVSSIDKDIEGRELFALVDMLIGKNLQVNNFIGMENSKPCLDGKLHASSFSIVLKYLVKSKNIIMT